MPTINYIPWIISIIAILVTLYSLFHKENKDKAEKESSVEIATQVAIAKLDVKLSMILDSMNEMKTAQSNQDKRIDKLSERLSKVEEYIKGR